MNEQQKKIYQTDGDRYEALISREDYEGNILKSLQEIVDPAGKDIFDLGAGTGRLTLLLAPFAKSIRAFDVSEEMLRVCKSRLAASGLSNWEVDVADHRQLPVEIQSADIVVSGWSVAYLYEWNADSWREEMKKWMDEMKRVIRKNGYVILFESLGTGYESPVELEHLKDYYPWLEESGFKKKWIRTDYKFESVDEADELTRFFFGDTLGDRVRKNNLLILPECTGVWWKEMK